MYGVPKGAGTNPLISTAEKQQGPVPKARTALDHTIIESKNGLGWKGP